MDVKITQDIRKFKTKDLGNFSIKEICYIVVAAAVGIGAYKFLHFSLDSCVICAVPVLIFGFLKPFGLSFRQFIATVCKEEFFSPRVYHNETDFVYDADEFEEIYEEKILIPSGWDDKEASSEYKHSKEDLKEIIR